MPASPRVRVRLGGAVVLVLLGLGVAVLVSALGSPGQSAVVDGAGPSSSEDAEDEEGTVPVGAVLYIHLLGAIARPGLYELPEGARAIDVVAAAGGFAENADRTQLNLARPLSDGEQIYVPAIGEVPAAVPGGGAAAAQGGKVNLNTADAAALETLPRVGPAMAARILDWRAANGRFASVDDLRAITGIGEKTFAALKDLVTV